MSEMGPIYRPMEQPRRKPFRGSQRCPTRYLLAVGRGRNSVDGAAGSPFGTREAPLQTLDCSIVGLYVQSASHAVLILHPCSPLLPYEKPKALYAAFRGIRSASGIDSFSQALGIVACFACASYTLLTRKTPLWLHCPILPTRRAPVSNCPSGHNC